MNELKLTFAGLEITAYLKIGDKYYLYSDRKLLGISVASKIVLEMMKYDTTKQKTLF